MLRFGIVKRSAALVLLGKVLVGCCCVMVIDYVK